MPENERIAKEIEITKRRIARENGDIESNRQDIENLEMEISAGEDLIFELTNRLSQLEERLFMTDEAIEAKQQQDELDEIEARKQEDLLYKRYGSRHVAQVRDYWRAS